MKRIVVLGSNGMLGQMVVKYFSPNFDVISINNRYSIESRYSLLNLLKNIGDCYIINCIGKIKQKTEDPFDLALINSLLPLDIYNNLNDGQILIHPSTDCVYSGNKSSYYLENDAPDATDEYGWSKRLGEQALIGKPNAYILRVSIIGPDFINNKPSGLLGWFLSNPSKSTIKGYINHFWNGITTLQWCKYVEQLVFLDTRLENSGKILQLGTLETYSKFEMLKLFQKYYKTDYIIDEFEDASTINRCMHSHVESPSLEAQLEELILFTNSLK